jgi:hypothetical protein
VDDSYVKQQVEELSGTVFYVLFRQQSEEQEVRRLLASKNVSTEAEDLSPDNDQ